MLFEALIASKAQIYDLFIPNSGLQIGQERIQTKIWAHSLPWIIKLKISTPFTIHLVRQYLHKNCLKMFLTQPLIELYRMLLNMKLLNHPASLKTMPPWQNFKTSKNSQW